jgi:hypothetical protein
MLRGRHRVREKEGKNGLKYVMSGIAGKYPKFFVKESRKNLLPKRLSICTTEILGL